MTYNVIGKLMDRKLLNMKLNNVLQQFLLQVHHQRVIITANNYFAVDMNLLVSVSDFDKNKTR